MALLVVRAALDAEAGVWYVTGSDVPGLATEAQSFDELCQKILVMVPELLDANGWEGDPEGGTEIPIEIIASRSSRVRRVAA
jgi:hypothetical protein